MKKASAETATWMRNEIKANDAKRQADMKSKGAKVARPKLDAFRDSVKPVYAKAKEKYGADVDAFIADVDEVHKSMPAKQMAVHDHGHRLTEGAIVAGVPALGTAADRRTPLLAPGRPSPAPIRWPGHAVDWSIMLIGALMASMIFINVIVHNAFEGDVTWTTELGELLMVRVTFLGTRRRPGAVRTW